MESLHMFAYSRTSILIGLGNIAEKKWDEQPAGFPNTIRWNAGHMYMTTEVFLNKANRHYKIIHPEWEKYFIDGTRPSKWEGKVPTREEILLSLEEQKERVLEFFQGNLHRKADETQVFHALALDSVEAALQFVTWHDGIHLGIVKSMDKTIK